MADDDYARQNFNRLKDGHRIMELTAENKRLKDEAARWLVPESHRPTCPLNGEPCTSWTCLVDVCVDPTKEG